MRRNVNPNAEMYRVVCSSGFILGRPVPLPALEKQYPGPYKRPWGGKHERTPEQRKAHSDRMKAFHAKRRETCSSP